MTFEGNVKITEANLISFGKLSDYKIELSDGLNLIYGRNGAGKSTVQLFFKAMFYGLKKRKASGESLKERERAIPYGENYAEGSIVIEYNDRLIEIKRRFGKTSAGDITEAYDAVTGDKNEELSCNCPGEHIFKLSEKMFVKSLWVRQNDVVISGRDDEITARLANLTTGGDEEASAEAAIDKLKKALAGLKAPSARYLPGRVDLLNKRLYELGAKRRELSERVENAENNKDNIKRIKTELKELAKQIEETENLKQNAVEARLCDAKRQRFNEIKKCDDRLDEIKNDSEYKRCLSATAELAEKAAALEKRISEIKSEAQNENNTNLINKYSLIKKSGLAMVAVGSAAALMFAIWRLFTQKSESPMLWILFAVGILFAGLGIIMYLGCKNKIKKSGKTELLKDRAADSREVRLSSTEKELEDILTAARAVSAEEIYALYNKKLRFNEIIKGILAARENFLGKDLYEDLAKFSSMEYNITVDISEVSESLKKMREKQLELTSELNRRESRDAEATGVLPSDIDAEIRYVKNEIKKCNIRISNINMAIAGIEEADAVRRMEFVPMLNKTASEILEGLTLGGYSGMTVGDDYKIKVREGGERRLAEYLSVGTYEQVYLALRLALARMLAEDKILFLDDILISYDNERAESALNLLNELGEKQQIVLFACRESERNKADALGAHIINI